MTYGYHHDHLCVDSRPLLRLGNASYSGKAFMRVLLVLLFLTAGALGQAPKATPSPAPVAAEKPAALPLNLELSGTDAKTIDDAYNALRIRQLEYRNFELELERQLAEANKQKDALKEKAEEERRKWGAALSRVTKIPPNKLDDYLMRQEDGKWIITKKPPANTP